MIRRIFVEKKQGFNVESEHFLKEFRQNLNIDNLEDVRIVVRYDMQGIDEETFLKAKKTILSEPNVDNVYQEEIKIDIGDKIIPIEYLPGQYDQRADSASQCIQILSQNEKAIIKVAKLFIIKGDISLEAFQKIKQYVINPVDSRKAKISKATSLEIKVELPDDIKIVDGFIKFSNEELTNFRNEMSFAMSEEDLFFVQSYFNNKENRNPTITELRVIDTYWSDHCRHTTFLTEIKNVQFEKGKFNEVIKKSYKEYLDSREFVYGNNKNGNKPLCLMDIALMGMKDAKKRGLLNDLDESDEINACSVEIDVNVDGKDEKWLLMFKNETHNHPTEIEPFGGAATCLGGAIRDPLSGRSYVYQAMRITGSADPRTKIINTLPGKLPQRKITIEAAHGFSSYGNQIGIATGQVAEFYDEGFVAKRMEIGAVIGAAPKKNVIRERPQKDDVILLLGGKTGRDGCGGATGSSKVHTEESILKSGAEVQKGNPVEERKIQRLFRNPELTSLIKKCNDFGAGGISVAIGELADSLEINLDLVPKKYEGLDGTELAISESQERMAVVVDPKDVDRFIKIATEENLEVTPVAKVTDSGRLIMKWRNKINLNLSREFLNTNGAKQFTKVKILEPQDEYNYFSNGVDYTGDNIKDVWLNNLRDINIACQKGLTERFDSTIGAATVLMPFGGKYSMTSAEGMVAKLPVLKGTTDTCSIMTFGYNPKISKWSPFHGGFYAVIESLAKIIALGGDFSKAKLSLQEYFERLGEDSEKWGKPFSALLGAFYAQKKLGVAAIGGKDSMSGTFKDMNVPPTLVSFAVSTEQVQNILSPEFKTSNSVVVLVSVDKDELHIPDFENLKLQYKNIYKLVKSGKVLSAKTIGHGGISAAISKMCFGNLFGFNFKDNILDNKDFLFYPYYGDIILEMNVSEEQLYDVFGECSYKVLGRTTDEPLIKIGKTSIELKEIITDWEEPLNDVFPITEDFKAEVKNISFSKASKYKSSLKVARPRVFIPVFPGTNCEYDSIKAFENAGAITDTFVFRNLTSQDIEYSIEEMKKRISNAQIIMIPGGFSAGDEPDGSGKFIATVFRNSRVKDQVNNLLKNRDGLILGICNGFQALIKLGLLPYGEIREIDETSPTLTFNKIGRHISKMVTTKITSNLSPWFNNVNVGDMHSIAMSHGEGRFVASEEEMKKLIINGQIATQYVDFDANATSDGRFNPNASFNAVEGISSPDGKILGKMGHSERIGNHVCINIPGEKDQMIFKSGVEYFG